jgi:signal transduction histidine kinase
MSPRHLGRLQPRDLAVTAIYLVVCLVMPLLGITSGTLMGTAPVWGENISTVIVVVASLGTLTRRHRPGITLAVTGVLSAAEILGGSQVGGYVLLFEALWSPIVHGGRSLARVTTGAGVALSVLLIALLAASPAGPIGVVVGLLLTAVVVATPLAWGWEVRLLHESRRTAESLAAAEQELATERAGRAVDQERTRIAQDLHDVLAGHLSAVAMHTRLAETLADPSARTRSLHTARDSSEAALRDLRSLLTVLTEQDRDLGTGPDPLPEATLSWDGIADRLRVDGDQDRVVVDPRVDDPAQVDPAVRAVVLRIGAEAVTNAVRHGRGPRTLQVDVTGDAVVMTCVNALGDRDLDGNPGAGHRELGISAMQARAGAVGGRALSGPDPADADRWRVAVCLPRHTGTALAAGNPERATTAPTTGRQKESEADHGHP